METVGFLVKKFVSLAVYPLGWSLLLMVTGLLTLFLTKRRRIGLVVVSLGVAVLLAFSSEITCYKLVHSLESQAGGYQTPSELERRGVRYVVVLAAELVEDGAPPADSWGRGLHRVMEGIRLAKGIDGCKLVLSGGAIPGRPSVAEVMARLPEEMGISRDMLILNTTVFDTEDEARTFSQLLGDQPFGLVTSASHIPRSMRLFRKYGSQPIACPCEFHTLREPFFYSRYMPSPGNLLNSHRGLHEYFGMWWLDIKELTGRN